LDEVLINASHIPIGQRLDLHPSGSSRQGLSMTQTFDACREIVSDAPLIRDFIG
jgi:hypothetical protein